MHSIPFVGVYVAWSFFVFGWPMVAKCIELLDGEPFGVTFVTTLSLSMFAVVLEVLALLIIALISVWLLKIVAVVLCLINAAALYFIWVYGIVIDDTMVLNVLATDQKTTVDLLHPWLFAAMLALGVLPSIVILRMRIVRSRFRNLVFVFGAVLIAYGGFAFTTSSTWPWIDKNLPTVGGVSLPWSYVFNSARVYYGYRARNQPQKLLPDAVFESEPPGKELVVLIIGESARAASHPDYGYARQTNPYTADLGVVALGPMRACATYTLGGLACIFTHVGEAAGPMTAWEPLPNYLYRHGVDVAWRTNSSGEPRVEIDDYKRLPQMRDECSDTCPDFNYDEGLLADLAETIEGSSNKRQLIVIHLGKGSHGPTYFRQYPQEFELFTPVCKNTLVKECSGQELLNVYDNTMAYTDFVLSQAIEILAKFSNIRSTLIYTSDHGESLGENGVYLHGVPKVIAPDEQLDVPFLIWQSRDARAISAQEAPYSHDHIFHSVMGAFDMTSPIYKPQFDIFAEE